MSVATRAQDTTRLRNVKEQVAEDSTAAAAASSDAAYTWQEVAKHNTRESAWVIINSSVYDVTEWIDKHPGGDEMILLHAGRECTDTFASYHPFSNRADKILNKYKIGKLVGPTEFPVFKPDSGFYKECCKRVQEYFKKNQLDPKDPLPGLWRMMLVLYVATIAYVGMHGFVIQNFYVQMIFASLFGACQALPLLHVMHDSSHAAISNSPTWWKIIGRTAMDFYAGASMTSWHNQHIVGHHVYTNVAGADPDLPVNFASDIRRIVERQVLRPMYKFQHVYLPPLYGALGLKFRFQDIAETFVTQTNGPIRVNPHSLSAWAHMIGSKAFWAWYRIWVPLMWLQVPASTFWPCFLMTEWVTGWYLAFNFQVSHVSTECEYPNGDEVTPLLNEEWAISQVKTSVDYGHGSPLVAFLSGALNYQITHHLFPGVSQYHYPAIAPIIMEVCKKYKVKYTVFPTFKEAFGAHLRHLKEMGEKGQSVHVHMG